MNDALSNQRLAPLYPLMISKVNAAANVLAGEAIFCRIAEGLRTYALSDADFALGRTVLTKPDGSHQGIVTEARGGFCWHNFGMAVDCYPFLHGTSGLLNWDPSSAQFQAMVTAMKAQGLAWGGDWHSIKDNPHFQLSEIPATPTDADRAAFAAGGIEAVWKLLDAQMDAIRA
jgi:peptidoglycan L-alanyl-D-glutamate endopeptidase CwlK